METQANNKMIPTQAARNFVVASGVLFIAMIAGYFNIQSSNSLAMEKQALSSLPVPACIMDDKNNYIWANKALLTMIHKEESEFVGKNVREIYKDDFASQVERINAVILATHQPITVKQNLIDIDGETRTLVITRYPIRLNGHFGIAVTSMPYVEPQNLPQMSIPIDVGAIE